MKLIECVPNISEGRDENIVNEIVSVLKNYPTIHVLDVDSGYDTNRTVITFIGTPDEVVSGAFDLIKKSLELINMKHHKGEHPRMGATDVCPFIPISDLSIKECINYSLKLAERLGKELNIPVYLYEKSSKNMKRSNLADIRSGEYEGISSKIIKKNWKPDFGPQIFHEKFGCIAVGVREFLLAYNINLNTTDKKIATDIALDIRERGRLKRDKSGTVIRNKKGIAQRVSGKFKFCKAVGWLIEEYNQAQVSINLTNFTKTSLHKVFQEVRLQARKRGVRVTGSEIVGLLPKKALLDAGLYYIKLQKRPLGIPEIDIINMAIKSLGLNDISIFKPYDKIIEYKISNKKYFSNLKFKDLIDEFSRSTPTPGGGSAAAIGATLGASLSSMVSNLTINKKGYEKHNTYHNTKSINCQKNILELMQLIDDDSKSFDNVILAMKLPKKTKQDIINRNNKILSATLNAADIPMRVLKVCNYIISDASDISNVCNINSISDIGVAAEFLKASAKSASYNVLINIKDLSSKDINKYRNDVDYYIKQIEDSYITITNNVNKSLLS